MQQYLTYVRPSAYFQNEKWCIDVYTTSEDGASKLFNVKVDLPEQLNRANPTLVRKVEELIKQALPAHLTVKVSLYFWKHFPYRGQQLEMDI